MKAVDVCISYKGLGYTYGCITGLSTEWHTVKVEDLGKFIYNALNKMDGEEMSLRVSLK